MSLTVVKRPEGHIVDTNAVTATVSSSSGALFTKAGHGLTTGMFIYIYSNLSTYNGYWYVSVVNSSTFRIREYATASDQAFINSGSVTYYVSVRTHGWNCVHLPITYKIKSDQWPTNGVDTARTITTFSNWSGYTYLVLSGDIKTTGTASSLEQVILTGTSVDGVYRIVQWFSETNIVIDLLYSAANVLSSGTCQYYYSNYHARIKVYAGLTGTHYWNAQKPYTLITEERAYPDSTGVITFNVNEFLKDQIEIVSNNSIKDTLPNNLDAFCQFYISVAESYDDSDGYSVDEYISSYTVDTFEGYAVNAKLPFKTRSAGNLDAYVTGLTSLTRQKFLTPFDRPTLFAGKYFDISYINASASSGNVMKIDRYTSGVAVTTYESIPDQDQGVYRFSLAQTGVEDRIDITLYSNDYGYALQLSETKIIDVSSACSFQDFYLVWMNYLGGYDYWNFTARKKYAIDVLDNKTQDVNIYATFPNSYGEFADSIEKQTVRSSKDLVSIVSQMLTEDQKEAISAITSSILVQICTSQYDRRTVLVSPNTLSVGQDRDKKHNISLSVSYTDDLPVQSQ